MNLNTLLFLTILNLQSFIFAAERKSSNYSLDADAISGGFSSTSSASYGNSGGVETIAGVSGHNSTTLPLVVTRHGLIGQLYKIQSLQLITSPALLAGFRVQISSYFLLDDLSRVNLQGSDMTFRVLGGEGIKISPEGVVTAEIGFGERLAIIEGAHSGEVGGTVITVLPQNNSNILKVGFGLGDSTKPNFINIPEPRVVGEYYTVNFMEPVGLIGFNYGAEWSPDLSTGNWRLIPDTGIAPNHVFSIPILNNTQMFIRMKVRILP